MIPEYPSCLDRSIWFCKMKYNIMALSHLNLKSWGIGVKTYQIFVLYKMLAIYKILSCTYQGSSAQAGGT